MSSDCGSAHGELYKTKNHQSLEMHMNEMMMHMHGVHPGVMPGLSAATLPFLPPKSCEFPGCTFSTPGNEFVKVSNRQAELQLHITMCHGRSGTEERNKCQTQTKVDRTALILKPVLLSGSSGRMPDRGTSGRRGWVAILQSPSCGSVSPARQL